VVIKFLNCMTNSKLSLQQQYEFETRKPQKIDLCNREVESKRIEKIRSTCQRWRTIQSYKAVADRRLKILHYSDSKPCNVSSKNATRLTSGGFYCNQLNFTI
jgi:hypothetical protein